MSEWMSRVALETIGQAANCVGVKLDLAQKKAKLPPNATLATAKVQAKGKGKALESAEASFKRFLPRAS
ncbi:hypothetical protein D9757_004034 [Collybiopsis confluens]|uniref:Uncharacterized protein n=1 Tax=Collybiopsis confluens TaxID=2823264 RepID=A0A8H5HWV4_9AGAR|nr:hypothetical protein D9757_004034 [Collybiopsis confluens]